ncbi:MAG: hypothetical protein CEE38_13330 [Planctomycetes bacterium B3_Pla]|nr:MAG: hypothetical protein CEE38_13330 [Planctomycetes bacterium B3_Pla]
MSNPPRNHARARFWRATYSAAHGIRDCIILPERIDGNRQIKVREIKSHQCAGSAEELTIHRDLQGNGNTQIGVALCRAAAMIAPVSGIFDKCPVFLFITEIESLGYKIAQMPRMQLRVAF